MSEKRWTIELYWTVEVEADTEDEALDEAFGRIADNASSFTADIIACDEDE